MKVEDIKDYFHAIAIFLDYFMDIYLRIFLENCCKKIYRKLN
jgi:hypothetical protein